MHQGAAERATRPHSTDVRQVTELAVTGAVPSDEDGGGGHASVHQDAAEHAISPLHSASEHPNTVPGATVGEIPNEDAAGGNVGVHGFVQTKQSHSRPKMRMFHTNPPETSI